MNSFTRLLFGGIFLLTFIVHETSSNECIDCTKCRKEFYVDGELSPDCLEGCKSDKMDNEMMKRCAMSLRCTTKEGVQQCACTHQACPTSGSHTLKLPVYLLLSYMFATLSLKYLV
ncbi:uncharacterized protein LOC132722402 [Ruditapes philippinarum]|uniref:uncharacterized protein LOC132722402 n=1 Tax=Ruditapes philippinarum TaxID=129788 RepID=UPI00295B5389|nr:uncharacterized protein LOC132722402 [Ruditapes philippinarum]